MAVAVSYDVDYGSRNAVLTQLGAAAGLTATALDKSAGETHPNWVQQINLINTALGLPTYANLDMSAFQTVVGAIVTKLNAPPPVPTITTAPAVTPSATQVNGAVLTTTNGTWTGSPTSYTRSWQRDAVAIAPPQTGVTYTTVAADATHSVRCSVVAVNGGGNSVASNSNAVAIT
jgi:hypothetical protein